MNKLILKLPKPKIEGKLSLEEAIFKRQSVRNFRNDSIDLQSLSQIFWAAQGKKGHKKTVPSAGATYPLEVYGIIKDKGLFHYDDLNHQLILINEQDLTSEIAEASWNQKFIEKTYLLLIICAEYQRTCQRYGERGVRYTHIEVGHCAQNVHLIAISLGLASVPIGAFNDNKIKMILDLPKEIDPLYIIPIGKAK